MIFSSGLARATSSSADEDLKQYLESQGPNKPTNSIHSAGGKVMSLISKLPDGDTKKGLLEYVSIAGLNSYRNDSSVAGGNSGIANYFTAKFTDKNNSCVRDAAKSFYADVAKELKSKGYPARPGIMTVAGQGTVKNLQAGWIWDLAMKHANGDANSAMFLVGMCGHDDKVQGNFIYDEPPDSSVQVVCPVAESSFYAPQSLGKSADISTDAKFAITAIQGPDGARKIPGKYYHVYGSAFMACQLIQNGVSGSRASLIERQAARAYRGIRMCEVINDNSNQADSLQKQLTNLSAKYQIKDPEKLVLAINRDIQSGKVCEDFGAPECDLFVQLGISPVYKVAKEFPMTDDMVKEKFAKARRNGDAVALYKKWYFGSGEGKLPCTDLRVWGPADLMNPTDSFFGRKGKPSDWSDQRYIAASKKLATWDVDFKWTMAQHDAGAKFAAENCKKRGPEEKALTGICPKGPPNDLPSSIAPVAPSEAIQSKSSQGIK